MTKPAINQNFEVASNLLGDVRHYSRQIWLAGLGAYAKAGQDGLDYLKDLVDAGASLEQQGKKLVGGKVESVSERFSPARDRLEIVREKVEERFEHIQAAFDERVGKGLNRLGIPSRQDVEALSAKLDVLSALLSSANKTK